MDSTLDALGALTEDLIASGPNETEKLNVLNEEVGAALTSGEYRVNRREAPFISTQTTRPVPKWAAGQEVAQTLGPFKNTLGGLVWFDFYRIKRQLKVARSGESVPFLSIPVDDVLGLGKAKHSLALSAGSVWFPSQQIQAGAPAGTFTGLAIRSGQIDFKGGFTISGDTITIGASELCTLTLHLAAPAPSADTHSRTGDDAKAMNLSLPETVAADCSPGAVVFSAVSNIALSFFGENYQLVRATRPARFDSVVNRIFIALDNNRSAVKLLHHASPMVSASGQAPITENAWALAVTQASSIDALGTAAGAGAVVVVTGAGLRFSWNGLTGLPVDLKQTYLLAEPGRIALTAAAAHSRQNRQQFDLWNFTTAPDTATVTGKAEIKYPKAIALWYNSLSTSIESLLIAEVDATLKLDRPVTADQRRVAVTTDKAECLSYKIGDTQYAYLQATGILNRLLQLGQIASLNPVSFALSNALIRTTPVDAFYLAGIVSGNSAMLSGGMKLFTHIYQILPSLPDPYVSSYSLPQNRGIASRELYSGSGLSGIDLFALVLWANPVSPNLTLGFEKSAVQTGASSAALIPPSASAQTTNVAAPSRTLAAAQNPVLVTQAQDNANAQALTDRFERAVGARTSGNLYLLDVSTNADLMGVGFAPAVYQERQQAQLPAGLPIGIQGIDLVSYAINTKVYTLPQIQWEPIRTIQNPDTSPYPFPSPATSPDTGLPTLMAIDSFKLVPIAPRPVIDNFISGYNDDAEITAGVFNLPFGMKAEAVWDNATDSTRPGASIALNQPEFDAAKVTGGIQIAIVATSPNVGDNFETPGFQGATIQTRNLIDLLTGTIPVDDDGHPLSVLGPVVDTIFNGEFKPNGANPRVPVERMDVSGYGASMFSNWLNPNAEIAATSQARFDVWIGRTSHEIIQVKSILYPWAVPVVRTITIQRTSGAGVTRYDSGWKAQGPGKYDFSYFEMVGTTKVSHPNPFEIYPGIVPEIDNVTSIKDTGRTYTKPGAIPPDDVVMQEVFFDCDVLLEDVTAGAAGGYVPSRNQRGFVQLAPYQKPLTPEQFYDLLNDEEALGGPVDCVVNVGASGQTMRVLRADVSGVDSMGGHYVFVTACHGSLKLPGEGSWSVVRRQDNTNQIITIDQNAGLPLIRERRLGMITTKPYRFADPADILQSSDPVSDYGILHSTGTQKICYLRPTIARGDHNIKSVLQPYFADSFAIVNSQSIFPDLTATFPLGAATGANLHIIEAGRLQLTSGGNFKAPPGYTRDIVQSGTSRMYVDYSDTSGSGDTCEVAYAFDSTAAVPWTVSTKNHSLTVDLAGFTSIVSVSLEFDAAYGQRPSMPKPKTTFGAVLQPIVDLLSFLGGQDIGQALAVSMSNLNTDSWQPKLQGILEVEIEFDTYATAPPKFEVKVAHADLKGGPPIPTDTDPEPLPVLKLECDIGLKAYFNMSPKSLTATNEDGSPATSEELAAATTDMISSGATLEIEGELHILVYTITPNVAGIYFVGILGFEFGIDSHDGKSFAFKVAVGLEIAAQWPIVGEVSVMMAIGLEMEWSDAGSGVYALMIFKGEAELLGGVIVIGIHIEAKGGQEKETNSSGVEETYAVCEVEFAVEVSLAFVIHFEFDETWQEKRQTA